ncbi:MAG: DUF2399 domain-containing protein [Bacillota bacterium]
MSRGGFEHTARDGAFLITTVYTRARRGSRPASRRVTAAHPLDPATVAARAQAGDPAFRAVWKNLRLAKNRGTGRLSEEHLRSRAAGAGVTVLQELVSWGVLERHQSLSTLGEVQRTYYTLTPAGQEALELAFGPAPAGLDHLVRELELALERCRRPELVPFFQRQLQAAVMGSSPAIELGETSATFRSGPARYHQILRFFITLGALPPGRTVDFKELAALAYPGEKDSVKRFAGVRDDILAAAEHDLGLSLAQLGVEGFASLYWVPVSGLVRPAGGPYLWGAAPALSTRDLLATRALETPARVLVLVENRSALDYLAARPHPQVLAIGTDGMPRSGLYLLLSKLAGLAEKQLVIWVDWDLGGLRIAARLLAFTPAPAQLVPHPGLAGVRAEVPPEWLQHHHPGIRAMAGAIARHGAVYQESALGSIEGFLPGVE